MRENMAQTYTTLAYTDVKGGTQVVHLPTIQSIEIPDKGKLPSKPTVTGQYKQQYTVTEAPQITFTMWLEDGTYAGETVDSLKMADLLSYLKKNKIKFNMATSHSSTNIFLNDLAIESVNYSRSSTYKNRLIATVTCTKLQLVTLEWEVVDSVDIFGSNIYTSEASSTENSVMFVMDYADDYFGLTNNDWLTLGSQAYTKLVHGSDSIPIPEKVGAYINKELPPCEGTVFFKLGDPIDLSSAPSSYNCAAVFTSKLGSADGATYDVTLAEFTVETTKDNTTSTVGEIPYYMIKNSGALNIAQSVLTPIMSGVLPGVQTTVNYMFDDYETAIFDKTRAIYNFANTYPNFNPSYSFETLAQWDELTEYCDSLTDGSFQTDKGMLGTDVIVRTDTKLEATSKILVYPIDKQYGIAVSYKGTPLKFTSNVTGGFDIQHVKLTTKSNSYAVDAGEHQSTWDSKFMANGGTTPLYELYVIMVSVGKMVQLYLLAPSILTEGKIV